MTAVTITDSPSTVGLPMEFLNLPEIPEKPIDVTSSNFEYVLYFGMEDNRGGTIGGEHSRIPSLGFRNQGNVNPVIKPSSSAAEITRSDSSQAQAIRLIAQKRFRPVAFSRDMPLSSKRMPEAIQSQESVVEVCCFASHGSCGVVDSGASKTVIGSNLLADMIRNLSSEVREKIFRCRSSMTFRFGNQGTLCSEFAVVIPIGQLQLKIAVVPGNTPFLLSNTLMRALKANIDCEMHKLRSPYFSKSINLQLTTKGLYLVDLNDLVTASAQMKLDAKPNSPKTPAVTFLSEQKSEDELERKGVEKTCENQSELKVSTSLKPQRSQKMSQLIARFEVNSRERQESVNDVCSRSPSAQIVPEKVCRHGEKPCSAPEEDSDRTCDSRAGDTRSVSPQPSGSCEREDHIRPNPPGKDIPADLGCRSALGEFHGQSLQQEHQSGASALPALCGTQGARDRKSIPRSPEEESEGEGGPESSLASVQGISSPPKRVQRLSTWTPLDPRCGRYRTGCFLERGFRRSRMEHREVHDSDYGQGSPSGISAGAEGSGSGRASEPHAQHRAGLADSDHAHRGPEHAAGSPSIDPHMSEAACSCLHEMENPCLDATEASPDRKCLWKLIAKISQELEDCCRQHTPISGRCELAEVFCNDDSMLTKQMLSLGKRAFRFGLAQGDLSTEAGRAALFYRLATQQPENLWFSPECGPWSPWTQLNSQKSIESWDYYQVLRRSKMYQIALGIVLCRFQISRGKHFHWEQPLKSMMFKSPLISEIHQFTQACQFDMCTAGELRDPVNKKHIKKGMIVLTTSPRLFEMLHGQTCRHQHEHQILEGQTQWKNENISRTRYSENYPRKFARQVVQVFANQRNVKPFGHVPEIAETHPTLPEANERPSKRSRVTVPSSERVTSEVLEPDQMPMHPSLSRRVGMKQPAVSCEDTCKQIMQEVGQLLPRVGRIEIHQPEIIQKIQAIFADKRVCRVLACRGTDRTLAPPKNLHHSEAPCRRTMFVERATGKIKLERYWEKWTELANRQLIRKGHACRINVTVFGCNLQNDPEPLKNSEGGKAAAMHEKRPGTTLSPVNQHKESQSLRLERVIEEPKPREEQPQEEKASLSPDKDDSTTPLRFRVLSKTDQAALLKIHKNLGHPSNERLSTALQQAGRISTRNGTGSARSSLSDMFDEVQTSSPKTVNIETLSRL